MINHFSPANEDDDSRKRRRKKERSSIFFRKNKKDKNSVSNIGKPTAIQHQHLFDGQQVNYNCRNSTVID